MDEEELKLLKTEFSKLKKAAAEAQENRKNSMYELAERKTDE